MLLGNLVSLKFLGCRMVTHVYVSFADSPFPIHPSFSPLACLLIGPVSDREYLQHAFDPAPRSVLNSTASSEPRDLSAPELLALYVEHARSLLFGQLSTCSDASLKGLECSAFAETWPSPLMPPETDMMAPITARRFLDLAERVRELELLSLPNTTLLDLVSAQERSLC